MRNFHSGDWTTSDGAVIRGGELLVDDGSGYVISRPDQTLGVVIEVVSGTLTPGEVHAFKEGWEAHFPNVVAEEGQFVARGGLCASHDPIAKDIEPYFEAFLRETVDA